mgnify:CR=1 FL=1
MKAKDSKFGKLNYCQVCNSKKLKKIIKMGSTGLCDSLLTKKQLKKEKSYPLNLVRCTNCQLIQLDYTVNNKEVFHLKYPYKSGITKPLTNLLHSTSKYLRDNFEFSKNPLAIDIGSNDGTLLRGFKKQKFEVLGVEPTNIAKLANKNGIKTLQSFFDIQSAKKISEKFQKAEVITGTNIFAHINKLNSFMEGVKLLLDKKKGLFVTESHYAVNIIEQLQYDSIYHEHLRFYLLKPLDVLMRMYGFKIIDAIKIPNYGGSIRVIASLNQEIKPSNNVKKILNYERSKGFYTSKKYTKFSNDIKKNKKKLSDLLLNIKEKNKRIVGIGCPGRCITLLAYCNINNKILDYIAEQSTSLKLNLYTPNTHIQVLDEKYFFKKQPDYALILSWHYGKNVMKNLRDKGFKGKFILPLPIPKIIN